MMGNQLPQDSRWRVAWICLVLAVLTAGVFGQTLGYGFVDYDDGTYLYGNPVVAHGLTLSGIAWTFTHMDCSLYHPLTMVSLMADFQIYGLHGGGFHLTNLLFHTASAILLFLVLRQMTGATWCSAFVAAVFAIHPLHVESVAWMAERKDVLSGFYFMLTLAAYARYVRQPDSKGRYWMVATAFLMALLSKPTVVTLPFVLWLLDYWPLNRFGQPGALWKLIREKIPLLAMSAGSCALTLLAAGKEIALHSHISASARVINALVSYAVYLRQMIWPKSLAAFYAAPLNGYSLWTAVLCLFVLMVITAIVLSFQRKHRWLLTGWLWYLGMLLPMIGIVTVGPFVRADRMTYLPQIGLYVMLTWTAAGLMAGWSYRRDVLGALAAVILMSLFFCARTQASYWHNNETLWTHALACTTDNFAAHNDLGNVLMQKGDVEGGMLEFRQALKIKPDYEEALNNLGNALLQKGNATEAIVQFQKALQVNPAFMPARNNLGNALLQQGKMDDAIDQYQQAIQLVPGSGEAHNNLGTALLKKGRVDDAIAQYKQAVQISPSNPDFYRNLEQAVMKKQ